MSGTYPRELNRAVAPLLEPVFLEILSTTVYFETVNDPSQSLGVSPVTRGRYAAELSVAISAAQRAGEIVSESFGRVLSGRAKSDGRGLVTITDEQAESTIREILSGHFDYSIRGEEHGLTGVESELQWVVDGLDGTTNFVRGMPFSAVSIGLTRGSEVLACVVLNPLAHELYCAEKGQGAYLNRQPIKVSEATSSGKPVVFFDTGYSQEAGDLGVKALTSLKGQVTTRKVGSIALEFCFVARGSADAFICVGGEPWDHCGRLLVTEAGGKVTDWCGQASGFETSFVLASNGSLHTNLVSRLSDLQPD